jgi:uncharacterized protein (TIGR02001 family)
MKMTKTSIEAVSRSMIAFAAIVLNARPVCAQDVPGKSGTKVEISANAALVSDYRFRGISLSERESALQGGVDVMVNEHLFASVWTSSIASYGGSRVEVDVSGGYAGEIGGLDYTVGASAYLYPGGASVNYGELKATLSNTVGPAVVSSEIAYAPDQSNTVSDNIYVGGTVSIAMGKSPLRFKAHGGYEDGFYDRKWDWEAGFSYEKDWLRLSVAAIGTNYGDALEAGNLGKTGVVAGVMLSF